MWDGKAGGGDWNGFYGPTTKTKAAYKNCKFLAPSINSANWTSMKETWKGLGLPEPLGVFQYCNTAPNTITETHL